MSEPPLEKESGPSRETWTADTNPTQTWYTESEDVKNGLIEPADLVAGLVPHERRIYEVKRAALMAYLQIEHRSFATIAKDLGVERATISAAFVKILNGLGVESAFRTSAARIAAAQSARVSWHQRKGGNQ